MTRAEARIAAVVLAAGAGRRFSSVPGAKLLAELRGRPVLWHVLAALRDYGPVRTVVVLGHGHEELERAIEWAGEERVVNPDPDRGMASSLKLGLHVLEDHARDLDGAFIVLGDQPTLRPDVLQALGAAAALELHQGAGTVAFAPRYHGEDAGVMNPVLLMRPGWALVAALEGDHGLAATLGRMGDRLSRIEVSGPHLDVDTQRDLVAVHEAVAPESRQGEEPPDGQVMPATVEPVATRGAS